MSGLRHHLLAAMSACVLAGLIGCGSSSTTPKSNATDADVLSGNAVVGVMVTHATTNDATRVLGSTGVLSQVLGLLPTSGLNAVSGTSAGLHRATEGLRAELRRPARLWEGSRIVTRRQGASADTTKLVVATGTYKVYPDLNAGPFLISPVPRNGVLIEAVNSDSSVDSVRVPTILYGTIQNGSGGYEMLPDSMIMDVYAAHPVATTNHHVGHVTFGLPIVSPGIPAGVRFSMDEPDVSTFSMGVAMDYANNIYTMSMAVSDLVLGTSASLSLALHFDGSPLQSGQLTQLNYVGTHTYSGHTWQNTLNFTRIYMDTQNTGADTAVVDGLILMDGGTAATIAGVEKTPTPPDTCAPVYVTVTSTGHRYLMCQVYGDLLGNLGGIALAPSERRWGLPSRFVAGR